jgi:2-dehydro-3-deoxyphosphogluconate aldolase/(4S)-4-hydroxy-2-oxoglutarate aldolase
MSIENVLKNAPILPVIILHDIKHALPLANALAEGGITTFEITLRTPVGLQAIQLLAEKMPQCTIGAGTITTTKQLTLVKDAGATFAVSPGITDRLVEAAKKINLPYLPAVGTPSEILLAIQHELSFLKFYPANLFGGIAALKSFAILFPEIKFCPTGGIDNNNLTDYLDLPNVISVGGSWLAPKNLLENNDWREITRLATQAKVRGRL